MAGIFDFLTEDEAVELARNPKKNLGNANFLQRAVNEKLRLKGFIDNTDSQEGRILSAYFNEQERLKKSFVESELERQFGVQNITGSTTTVNAAGQRVAVGGDTQNIQATKAQQSKVQSSFKTPLQLQKSGQSQAAFAASLPPPLISRRKDPTIISGAGIRRRRLSRGGPQQTILTSDADSQIGDQTLLG